MKKKKDHPISVRINGCEYENSHQHFNLTAASIDI